MSSQNRPERFYVWRSFWKSQGKAPVTVREWKEREAFSSFTALNNPCHLTSPPLCRTRTALDAKVTSKGWLCPANPVPPWCCPSSQLYPLLSSTANGSSVTFNYYCHSAGRSISNNCSLHASSSMYLAALSLNYSSDHLSLACSHPLLCSKCQSQISFSHLHRGQAPAFPYFLSTYCTCSLLLDFGTFT